MTTTMTCVLLRRRIRVLTRVHANAMRLAFSYYWTAGS